MEKQRSSYPRVFWVANFIEVLERFAYYGIYMGFGIYLQHLGYSKDELGTIQNIFIAVSYLLPLFSGTFADKYGFKKMLIFSYLAYLPSILLLIITKTYSGIALTMLSIGFAAGIFKPLISATVRATTDSTNKTLGFGIFYAMVNLGASIGPIVMGKVSRQIGWNEAYIIAAITIGVMFLVTIFFYKEPKREIEGISLKQKFIDIGTALSDIKFSIFIILLGLFFWMPFWAFFNTLAVYVNDFLDTRQLYIGVKSVIGEWLTQGLLASEIDGVWRINAEAISHTGFIILIFQVFVSRLFEKKLAIPSFMFGLFVMALGFGVLGLSAVSVPGLMFLGVLLWAFGEMISSPRIQEYITWIAPKEKAGLYMGTNFLATFIGGALAGNYSKLMGYYESQGNPEYVMYVLAGHMILGIIAIFIFTKVAGEFTELSE